MNVRSQRRWLAGVMILGFACAQFISLAHACMATDVAAGAVGASRGIAEAMPDCPVMARAATAVAYEACDAHCVPPEQTAKGADVRVALAPPTVFILRVVSPANSSLVPASRPIARITSPPLSLLFSRFLI